MGGPDAKTVACELITGKTCHVHVTSELCNETWLVIGFFSPSMKKYPDESPLHLIMAVTGHNRQPVRPKRISAPAPN